MSANQTEAQARRLVDEAIQCFRFAAKNEHPIAATAVGLERICQAAACHLNLTQCAGDLAATLHETAFDAAAVVEEAVDEAICADQIYRGLACAVGLVSPNTSDEFRPDRLSFAHLLKSELTIVLHQAELARRGNPLLRAMRIRLAMEAPRRPEDRTH